MRANGEVIAFYFPVMVEHGGRMQLPNSQRTHSLFEDGGVLGKDKTPFAPFWGDYDVTPQSR